MDFNYSKTKLIRTNWDRCLFGLQKIWTPEIPIKIEEKKMYSKITASYKYSVLLYLEFFSIKNNRMRIRLLFSIE